jgi:putative flavoprotein involved in K+ transport
MNGIDPGHAGSHWTGAVVVGAGPAGLATSWHLQRLGVEHVVLERNDVGETWRSARWDGFTLVSPNWANRMPGHRPDVDDLDGFRGRDEVVDMFASYAREAGLPVRPGVEVHSLESHKNGYSLATTDGTWLARAVVIASGAMRLPHIPHSVSPDPGITTLHAVDYRNPAQLEPGAVLVVGSGQSGSQITEELNHARRQVYLATSPVGRVPRRYRGRDAFAWLRDTGFVDVDTADADPRMRQARQPVVSGAGGGHTIALQQLAREGVTLLGRLLSVDGQRFTFADDLAHNMSVADQGAATFRRGIDQYLEHHPDPAVPQPDSDPAERPLDAGYVAPTELDARTHGIATVLWCTGMRPDSDWLPDSLLDPAGMPEHHRGVTDLPGVYAVGLPWLSHRASGILYGIGTDAERIATRIQHDLTK